MAQPGRDSRRARTPSQSDGCALHGRLSRRQEDAARFAGGLPHARNLSMARKQRIVVGMSGGVDSSVAAWLLKEQGHEVVGLFMKNWEDDDDDEYCSTRQNLIDATSVA